MIKLVTYASNQFYNLERQELMRQGNSYDMVWAPYSESWLRNMEYYKLNKDILDALRLAGFCAWKPYIILHALRTCSTNDAIIYCDSSTRLIDNPSALIDSIAQCAVIGNTVYKNAEWTKRDCFVTMDCDEEKYWHGEHVWAGVSMWKPCDESFTLLTEWIKYAMDKRAITDDANVLGLPNFPGFVDHRHDQSILSLLTIKYNITKIYPVLLFHDVR
jgi:hypothetical protein